MKHRFAQLFLLCAITAGSSFASVIISTNPLDFADSVDWCQFGCAGTQIPSPQAWTSTFGATGIIELGDNSQGIYNFQQGPSWNGNFDPFMGVMYNGVNFGSTPADFTITFDTAHTGGGAFIMSNFPGQFTATLELFDVSMQSLGIVTATATSEFNPGTGFFLGAFDTVNPVWAMKFEAIGPGTVEPDFGIGLMRLDGTPSASPEPSTLLTMGLGMLGFLSLAKRRLGK